MSKSFYLPQNDAGKLQWLGNFNHKIGGYQNTLGLSNADIASVAADKAYFSWVMQMPAIFNTEKENWTGYKNLMRSGPIGSPAGQAPTLPALPAAPAAVNPGIFPRISALVKIIKAKPGYTEAIGHDLGIIGAEQIIDTSNLKPELKLSFTGGHVDIKWTKGSVDAIRIEADKNGSGFQLLSVSTAAHYIDTTPISSASTWKYRAIYLISDEQVGQMSDVASITVG